MQEQATTHGTFLVLCRSSGSLEVYTLPGLKPVAQFKAMHEGEATVPAEEPARAVRVHPCPFSLFTHVVTRYSCCYVVAAVSDCNNSALSVSLV